MPEPTEPRLFHLVHRLHHALFQAGDRMLVQELGITSSQSAVLMFLDKFKGASMGELASAVGLKITSVSGLIDRMEGKGLVRRTRSAADKRSFHISLTVAGDKLVARAKPIIQQNNARMLDHIGGQADIDLFANTCESLIGAIEEQETGRTVPSATLSHIAKTS